MIAQLAMYPFAHLREAYDELWAAVHHRLPDTPERLDREIDLSTAWHSPDLFVAQTCGWPLISELADVVEVIGAFDVHAPFAAGGRYRSVLVASKPLGIEVWKQDPTAVVVQNEPASLSGWVSMLSAWGGVPPNVLYTGSHVLSMRAVAAGEAQVASIDALSFEFLAETEPATVGRLHIIGHGPLVGTLPLVMSTAVAHRRDEVRAAFTDAVADPALADACARLRINAFVPVGLEHYESLRALVPPPTN